MPQKTQSSKMEGEGRVLKWDLDAPLLPIPDTNYASLLINLFPPFGDAVALVDAKTGKSRTYADLHRMSLRMQEGLASAGVGLGDAVMLLSKNHIDFPIVVFSIMLTGAACVPVNPDLTIEELAHVARVSEAKWVVANGEVVGKVKNVYGSLGSSDLKQIWIIGEEKTGNWPTIYDLMKSGTQESANLTGTGFDSASTVALIPFSSGTTGLPKGVMLSHRNFLTMYTSTKSMMSLFPDTGFNIFQSTLLLPPMYHAYGYGTTFSVLASGGKLVLLTKFSPEEYFEAIQTYKVTYSPIVPHLAKFITNTPLKEKYDLSSLMMFVSATAPISESTLDALISKTGVYAVQGYGMTETCTGCTFNGGVVGSKPNSVGKIGPFIEAKVIDTETNKTLNEGEEGELCFRGPGITLGYINNPKATAEIIDSEGWLHTGDAAYYDEDGFIFITDRLKDLIKVKGYQVSPAEIEAILLKAEEVGEVAVAGVPNNRLGEAPRAWVVPAEGATIDPAALIKLVADHVVPYKQLAGGVEVVKSLPRNHLGKILRRQLKQSYSSPRSKL